MMQNAYAAGLTSQSNGLRVYHFDIFTHIGRCTAVFWGPRAAVISYHVSLSGRGFSWVAFRMQELCVYCV